jgi:hypothetical protein
MNRKPDRASAARSLYAPGTAVSAPDTGPSAGGFGSLMRDFYADPVAWAGLAVCTLILTYGGGAVMFWFHAIYLGEGGPAVSPYLHWALDSSAGFLGLTPPIALILPIAAWTAMEPGPWGDRIGRVRVGRFALVGGVLLAVVTAPAPLIHDSFLARGTWLADHITKMWGGPQYISGHVHHEAEASPVFEMAQQVVAGIPTYVPLMFIGLMMARGLIGAGRRAEPVLEAAIDPVIEAIDPAIDPAIEPHPIDPV